MSVLDARIAKAVKIIWIDVDYSRGQEALKLFEEAAAEGSADAYYYLARCYAGSCFVPKGFGYEENDDKCEEYLNLSIEHGSAVGMFAGRRFGGFKPRCGSFIQEPYHSDAEVWDAICDIARQGDLFSKYLVANAYYYGDVIEMLGVDLNAMEAEQFEAQVRNWKQVAADMYEELIASGMMMGVPNYLDILTSGEFGMPKNEKRAQEVRIFAADRGDRYYMVAVGESLEDTDIDKAVEYYERAWSMDYPKAGFKLGRLYTLGGKLPRDLAKAEAYFLKCLNSGNETVGCNNRLGEIYFYGGDGVQQDYAKAFKHLLAAHDEANYWGSDMLGTCYLKGLGTAVDYAKAKEELSRYTGEALSAIGLGEIYAYGLGVKADIKKGMEYWDKFPNHPASIENKKNFKKTLFGWKKV